MITRYIAICLPLFLMGCSLAPFGDKVEAAAVTVVSTGIEDRMAYNDKKAGLLLTAPCDISVGAYYRITNPVQQKALVMLCSGREPADPPQPLAIGTVLAPPAP